VGCRVHTRQRPHIHDAVIVMNVGNVRGIQPLTITHSPDAKTNNQAHSTLAGMPDHKPSLTEVRLKLLEVYDWAIKL
jgi:hypothetical protein